MSKSNKKMMVYKPALKSLVKSSIGKSSKSSNNVRAKDSWLGMLNRWGSKTMGTKNFNIVKRLGFKAAVVGANKLIDYYDNNKEEPTQDYQEPNNQYGGVNKHKLITLERDRHEKIKQPNYQPTQNNNNRESYNEPIAQQRQTTNHRSAYIEPR